MTMMQTPRVAPSNTEQARAWDGDEGAYWATHADVFERSLAGYMEPFFAAAQIEDTSQVLDIGCGTGGETRAAARMASAGAAFGVDLSARMIEVARLAAAREGLPNARFEQADAQVHPFPEAAFDVAISRTSAMFFGDPAAAWANIARALRPGSRLVLLVWQPFGDNEWIVEVSTALAVGRQRPSPPPGAPGPFSMSDPDRVVRLLGDAGFVQPRCESLTAPMWFGPDARAAFDFLSGLTGWMLEGLEEAGRASARAALRSTIDRHETPGGVLFDSAAWLVTARRPG